MIAMKYYDYYYGHKISDEGLKYGYIDYECLSECVGGMVLNNDIIRNTLDIGEWEEYNGSEYNEEADEYKEIFQYYIINRYGAEFLAGHTNEIVWYNEKLDLYVWGITQWGTPWDNVLTDIKCKERND